MGLEAMIARMPEKKRKLFQNLVSVGVIFSILYAYMNLMMLNGNVMSFLQSQAFIIVVMVLIFMFFAWKLLSGAKLQLGQPNQQQKQKPQQPQQYQQPIKRQPIRVTEKKRVQQKQTPIKPHLSIQRKRSGGSWYCPKCGSLVIGQQCNKCGYRK